LDKVLLGGARHGRLFIGEHNDDLADGALEQVTINLNLTFGNLGDGLLGGLDSLISIG
jgi:hypothetical protein